MKHALARIPVDDTAAKVSALSALSSQETVSPPRRYFGLRTNTRLAMRLASGAKRDAIPRVLRENRSVLEFRGSGFKSRRPDLRKEWSSHAFGARTLFAFHPRVYHSVCRYFRLSQFPRCIHDRESRLGCA